VELALLYIRPVEDREDQRLMELFWAIIKIYLAAALGSGVLAALAVAFWYYQSCRAADAKERP
jgi:hypothetical protein